MLQGIYVTYLIFLFWLLKLLTFKKIIIKMKLKLNVLERIILLGLLPKDENYLTFKLITQLKADLSFSDKEIKDWGITMLEDGRVTWKKTGDKQIEIGETIETMIVEKLKTVEKEKKINDENVSLYEKFVVDRKKEE